MRQTWLKRVGLGGVVMTAFLSAGGVSAGADAEKVPAHLPGELSADQVLNGDYPFPPSPVVELKPDDTGLARERLTPVPPPGVHPRVLISPQDLPDLRRRLTETAPGQALLATLRQRTAATILKPGAWENDVYRKLAAGDAAGAMAVINEKHKPSDTPGHYQPHILYAVVMESFDAMVSDDTGRGKAAAAAVAGWAKMVEPLLDESLRQPLNDDVWRAKVSGPATGTWSDAQGIRDLLGGHLLGYAYDFSYNFMTDADRAQVRRVIAKATAGRVWMGARLPHHFRNWNWIAVGLQQPLLALAIEGEEGYDPRVYKLGAQIARDYLTYGISAAGCSTEAVGYTQFGLVWGNPFFVAAQRRGEPLLTHPHHRAMLDWYIHSLEPYGGRTQSHGDGGDGMPAIWTLSMWRHFFPADQRADFLWQNYAASTEGKPFEGKFHIIEPLLWCSAAPTADFAAGQKLNLPLSWFDPARGSLNVRSGWDADATLVQFESRVDSVGASHEHADRGNFTFSALGRAWSRESFRSIETRHHSNVLIDGLGQGYWPGPGKWIGHVDAGWAVSAAIDAKDAYDWWWPKSIMADADGAPRFAFDRWASYRTQAAQFREDYKGVPVTRDDRPSVKAFWEGFADVGGGPRLWDEDGWPVRLPQNPVRRAFRTIVFVREPTPYLLVVDDVQKDDQPRLYEWLMQTGPDTELASLKTDEAILCDSTVPRDANGLPKPKKGDRQLLVRVLNRATAPDAHEFQATPSIRLETFEKKDTNSRDGRTFGLDKRLVIPSRSTSPAFKVLLLPFRAGATPPVVTWDDNGQRATIRSGDVADVWAFSVGADGRTRVAGRRDGKGLPAIEEVR
jgi:hypothetical protein